MVNSIKDKIELVRSVQGEQQRLVGLSMGLTLFTPIPFIDTAKLFNTVFQHYQSMVPKDVFKWQNLGGTNDSYKKITTAAFRTISSWLNQDDNYNGTCSIWLKDGGFSTDVGEYLFNIYGKDVASSKYDSCYVRLYFPYDIMDVMGSDVFIDEINKLMENLPFYSGYLGYTLNLSNLMTVAPYSRAIDKHIFAVTHRFQGVEIFKPHLENYEMKKYLRSPAWVTFLSKQSIEKLGGIEQIRLKIKGEFSFRKLQHGWGIQSGSQPLLGDRNHQQVIAPEQREFARLLIPFYSPNPAFLFSKREHEDSIAWIRRLTDL